ncbi:MAG TPA: cation:dicarboxylase symporter family transporter, partial [Mucilaginibacter sp.]|nr:cation:dicarboxylase symporter family transporter [Mucilaginibacter sp.]
MKKLLSNLTFQVVIAILLGVIVGAYFRDFGPTAKLISDKFIDLIKMLIAPIIFLTMVLGIAGMGDMRKVGRVGGKALLYFEIVTTFALVMGVAVANIIKPGSGLPMPHGVDTTKLQSYQKAAAEMKWGDFFAHIIPSNVFEAFAQGDILQILFFAILFGYALSLMRETGKPVVDLFDKLNKVFFNIMGVVMRIAPIGAFAGIAYTVAIYGVGTLKPLMWLMISVLLTMLLFIFIVLFVISLIYK